MDRGIVWDSRNYRGNDLCSVVPSICMDTLHCLTFTSMSKVSSGNRHLKYLCTKLHCGTRMQAIWKIIYIVLYSFLFALSYITSCVLFYTVSCVLEAKVNHVTPCLSITWKSSGSSSSCI